MLNIFAAEEEESTENEISDFVLLSRHDLLLIC